MDSSSDEKDDSSNDEENNDYDASNAVDESPAPPAPPTVQLAAAEKDQLLTKVASTGPVTWQRGCQRGTGQSTQYMVT